ncbi:MAG: SHOCT domain-containing protein [Propioniciclava sp.]
MDISPLLPLLGHGPGHGFFGIIPAILIALLIVALVRLFRTGSVGPVRYHGAAPQSSPEDLARARLAERLAQGDITPEEYLERTSALKPPTTPEA